MLTYKNNYFIYSIDRFFLLYALTLTHRINYICKRKNIGFVYLTC